MISERGLHLQRRAIPLLRKSIVGFLLASAAFPAGLSRPIPERAVDVFTPVSLDEQRLAGMFAVRSRANIEGYLEHIDTDALLQPFRPGSTSAAPSAGETAGLFLIAASNSYEYSNDAQLRAVMDKVALQIEKTLAPDGYLGLHGNAHPWTEDDLLTETSSLLGLIGYWHVTGEDSAANALSRAANLLVKQFSQAGKLPPGASALAVPMVEMYRISGNEQYLNFCRSVTSLGEQQPSRTNLVSALTGYGLVELYRVTGADTDLSAARNIWLRLSDSGEFFAGVPDVHGRIDSCLTLAWFQFTLDLFRLTGELRYAALLEPLIYNAISAAQDFRTGGIDPAVPLVGPKKFSRGVDVCSAAEAVAISEIGSTMWGRYESGVAILSYNAGRASIRIRRRMTLQVYTDSNYPQSGNVSLHIDPSHPTEFPVRLLVPSWTRQFKAKIGDTVLTGQPGQFLTLNREWKKGDTVEISIQMTVDAVPDPRNHKRIAIRRGPELLTPVELSGIQPESVSTIVLDTSSLAEVRTPAQGLPNPTETQRYSIRGRMQNREIRLTLAPLASANGSDLWFQNGRGL